MSWPWNDQAAAGRLVDAADEIEDGALARAVGADDGEDLALRHVEGHAVHGPDAAEGDRDVVGLEQGRRALAVAACSRRLSATEPSRDFGKRSPHALRLEIGPLALECGAPVEREVVEVGLDLEPAPVDAERLEQHDQRP